MDEYGYYLTYRNATDRIRERVEQVQRSRPPGRRRTGRHAVAQRLHSIADRLDG